MVGVDKRESEKWYWHKSDHRYLVCYGKEFWFVQSAVRSYWKVELVGALK